MEMAPEKEEVVEQRVDMVYEIFKEVMQRPRIKPVFDKHHPEAHIKKATDEAHFRQRAKPTLLCAHTRMLALCIVSEKIEREKVQWGP